jgi:hypothetical protein
LYSQIWTTPEIAIVTLTQNFFELADLDNTPIPAKSESSEESPAADQASSPFSAFLERSRKQMEDYFRKLTETEDNGEFRALASRCGRFFSFISHKYCTCKINFQLIMGFV